MWRLLIFLVVLAYLVYMLTVFAHILKLANVTSRKVTFGRLLIPFYFWIVTSPEEVKKPKKKSWQEKLQETAAKEYYND